MTSAPQMEETRLDHALKTYQKIHTLAGRLFNSTSSRCSTSRPPHSSRYNPLLSLSGLKSHIDLPAAQCIASDLMELGCPEPAAHVLSGIYRSSAARIRSQLEAAYKTSFVDLSGRMKSDPSVRQSLLNLPRTVRKHHENLLQGVQAEARERANELVREMNEPQDPIQRPIFNQDFVPSLSNYFRMNAYPNASHRNFLARQSGMTPRQIAVWFQNHRNRARKEGLALKKNPDININVIVNNKRPLTPEDDDGESESDGYDESESPSSDDEDSSDEPPPNPSILTSDSTFSLSSPPHAFPNAYPPLRCEYIPFPSKEQGRTFAMPWYRKPAQPRSAKSLNKVKEPEVEDLCQQLMTRVQGRFVNKPGQKRKRKRRWDEHLRTIPQPAPLPSLISDRVYKPARPVKLPLPKPAPINQVKQAFQKLDTPPATLVPHRPAGTGSATGRWIARLPPRAHTPPQTHTPSRASTPSTPSTVGSPLFSPAPSLRRRPLEEDSSSPEPPRSKRRRISLSSSSSSSSLSSTLTTPQLGPTSLPIYTKTSVPSTADSEFDLSSLPVDGLLGAIQPSAPLTVSEALHFGFQSFQPPTMTAKDMPFDPNTFNFTFQETAAPS